MHATEILLTHYSLLSYPYLFSVAVSKALAEQWKDLDAESKAPYDALHAEAKAKLDAEYEESVAAPKKKSSKSKSTRSKNGKPKQPPKPQTLWSEKRRPQLKEEEPKLAAKEIQAKLNEEWKALDVSHESERYE